MTTLPVDTEVVQRSSVALRYRRFQPRLVLGYQQDLRFLIEDLATLRHAEARKVLESAIQSLDDRQTELRSLGLTGVDLAPTIRYAATLRVLRDLITQGWRIRGDDEGVILDAPGRAAVHMEDPEFAKESLRRSFAFARDAQLGEPATQDFIESMERRKIGTLFANGTELARRLTEHGCSGVSPELEIIEPGSRDEGTGLLLQDIWRYARLYWSIPYRSTPGRNVFCLVRDAAHPARPLIGIAALGNPVLGMAKRDKRYAWSADGLEQRLGSLTSRKQGDIAAHLMRVLRQATKETYSADLGLPPAPLVEANKVVTALEEIARKSAAERLAQLDEAGEDRSRDYLLIRGAQQAVGNGDVDTVDWEAVARTALYRRKRASTLANLYRALSTLTKLGFSERGGHLQSALRDSEGRRAIEIALRRVKQEALASNVMALITCGAVAPYRPILGGKLVALMMLSRQVGRDVEKRYGDRVSIIASAMAGHPIRRPAKLALITTSSLYEAYGSSQYNRLKVETPAGALSFRKVDRTESFGTVQFSPDTVHSLSDVARLSDANRREVNNLFGEGTSPKLRLIRTGLEALGLDANSFLRHNSRRIIYGVELCSNTDDVVLRLTARPKYLLPAGAKGTEILVQHWRDRWLQGRIGRPDVLEGLRAEEFEHFRLSRETAELGLGAASFGRRTVHVGLPDKLPPDVQNKNDADRTFIERLSPSKVWFNG